MSTSWLTYRTVILDAATQAFVDVNIAPSNRFEALWGGIVWLLARTPAVGVPQAPQLPGVNVLHVVAENRIAGTPEVWLLYSYDDGEVTIHTARFGEAVDEPE